MWRPKKERAPERKSRSQPHDAPRVVCFVLSDPRRRDLGNSEGVVGWNPSSRRAETENHQLAMLPMRMGGPGLRSSLRCTPAAHWATWDDASHMIWERLRWLMRWYGGSARRSLWKDVWVSCKQQPLSWTRRGSGCDRRGLSCTREPCEWPHRWQYLMLTNRTASRQAHQEFTVPLHLFRVLLLERASSVALDGSNVQWMPRTAGPTRTGQPAHVEDVSTRGHHRQSGCSRESVVRQGRRSTLSSELGRPG